MTTKKTEKEKWFDEHVMVIGGDDVSDDFTKAIKQKLKDEVTKTKDKRKT